MSADPQLDLAWPECQSSMVRGLESYSDTDLLHQIQTDPQSARYWVTLFCRHQQAVEACLCQHLPADEIPVWRHRAWRYLYTRLLQVKPAEWTAIPEWFTAQVSQFLNHQEFRRRGEDASWLLQNQGLAEISPILTCYLHVGLEELPADLRFVLVLTDRFRWSSARIAAQLRSEGYSLSPQETQQMIEEARQQLFHRLPADVRALYLTSKP